MTMFVDTLQDVLASGRDARFCAAGHSMAPTIRNGEYVRVTRCEEDSLCVGDVVLTAAPRGLTAHRIIELDPTRGELRIRTRGDNSLTADAIVPGSAVLGRIAGVERNGRYAAVDSRGALTQQTLAVLRRVRHSIQRRFGRATPNGIPETAQVRALSL
jgi:signal peptidase I